MPFYVTDQADVAKIHYSIWTAAEYGDLEVVRAHVEVRELDPNALDDYGYAALHLAAQQNHAEIVRYLLSKGARVDGGAASKCTPLHRACFSGAQEACEVLVEAGADLERPDMSFGDGRRPLHKAARHLGILKLLLDRGACLESRDASMATPLHAAAEAGDRDSICELLVRGAKKDAMDNDNRLPVHYAAAFGNEAAVEALGGDDLLINEARNAKTKRLKSLDVAAADNEDRSTVKADDDELWRGYVDEAKTTIVVAPARYTGNKVTPRRAMEGLEAVVPEVPLEIPERRLPDAKAAAAANSVFGALRASDARRRQHQMTAS